MNNGENLDDMDEYEEKIERGNFDRDVDDHELIPNFEEENMEYHDKGDANNDIGIQHDTNTTTAHTPFTESFYANTWENMVDPSHFQIPFVSTWEDGMHFSKGLTFDDAFLLHQKLWENCDKITLLVLMSSGRSYILSIIMSFLNIRYETQNKRQLLRYLGIRRSLTKGCESYCWHTWIKIQVPSTTIKPYLGT